MPVLDTTFWAQSVIAPLASAVHHSVSIPWADILGGFAAAFIGAASAFGFALWLARRDRRTQATLAMINEFSSHEILVSRFVTVAIADQVRSGVISLKFVASSSVQGCPSGFVGNMVEGLTEHQHMSQLIGWYRRLAVHLKNRWVNRKIIAATLGGTFGWTLPFLLDLGVAAEQLMVEHPSNRENHLRASWIYAMRYVDEEMSREQLRSMLPGIRRH